MRTLERHLDRETGQFTLVAMLEPGEPAPVVGEDTSLEDVGVCRVIRLRPMTGPLPGVRPEDRVLTVVAVRTVTGPDVPDKPFTLPR